PIERAEKTMTQLTRPASRQSMFSFRAIKMALVILVLMIAPSSTARAQWTTSGNNINNTNSGNVGIGVTSPAVQLEIRGPAVVFNDGRGLIGNYDTTAMAQGVGGGIQFGGKYHSNGTIGGFASISGIKENATDNNFASALVFTTRANGGNQIEKLRITSTGSVGIGTTSPTTALHLNSAAAAFNGFGQFLITDSGNTNRQLRFGYDASLEAGWIQASKAGTSFEPLLLNPNGGNIGVGTTAPVFDANAAKYFTLSGADLGANKWTELGLGGNITGTDTPTGHVAFYNTALGTTDKRIVGITGATDGATNSGKLQIFTWNAGTPVERMRVDKAGNVGIGTVAPAAKLDVNGNVSVTGNITATGNIAAKYQDVAEWVESSQLLPAGTVVVLDQSKSNQVIASSQAYDTRVAGVISAQPGITLGEKGDSKVLVATTGRVKVKVDASAGPIQVGDLLVTSDIAGVAKKSEPLSLGGVQIHRPGTLIGKALEPLEQGTGEILVLLSLQ
ncbi:MAG: hypothetical protein ACRD9S_10835, partial [Pyrinomonadaceae bacterium]